jgi:polysaccharide pyruvyl transferase WcaK-like protein
MLNVRRAARVKKTVSLIYAYGLRNAGDMAITLGAIDVLTQLGVSVSAFSMYSTDDPEFSKAKKLIKENYPEVRLFESPFRFNRDKGLLRNLQGYASGFLTVVGIKKPQDFLVEFLRSDMVVFNGGNLLRCASMADFIRLVALMYPLRIAMQERVPFLVFPQSTTRICCFGNSLLRQPLTRATSVWAREDRSLQYFKDSFPDIEILSSIDLAFFIDRQDARECAAKYSFLDGRQREGRIAFTVRAHDVGDLGELSSALRRQIIDCIEQTIRDLLKNGREIVLVVQTKKDRFVTSLIYGAFAEDERVKLLEEYNPLVLREIYSKCDALVGMRLHSIILAATAGTPAVGLFYRGWGLKNPGLMDKFGLPYKYIDEVYGPITREVEQVLEERRALQERIRRIIDSERRQFTSQVSGAMLSLDK